MLGFSSRRRQGLAVALSLLSLVGLVCLDASAVAKQQQGADQSKTSSAAACRQGKALFALGRFGAAEATFEKDLETDATVKCGREGLAKISRTYPCVAARSLAKNGEKTESNKAYIELLKVKPRKQCARDGANSSSDPDIWEKLKTFSEDALIAIGFIALAGLGLVALFLLLINILARIPWLRDRWPARKVRSPTVTIEKLDDSAVEPKLGAGTAALMKKWIEADAHRPWVKLVSGGSATEETWLSKVAEVGEQGKIAAAVIGLFLALLPRRHVKVTGELQPAVPSGGPGISVELHRKLSSRGTAVLWADRFALPVADDVAADTLRKLVVPTAAWVSHRVTTETGGRALVAKDPMSWALFKTGVAWHRDLEVTKAAELYGAAAQMDATNYGARANLAVLRAREGDFKGAIELLDHALEILAGERTGDHLSNPDWYRVSYSRVAEYTNWASQSRSCRKERFERASELSAQLERAIAMTLDQRQWGLPAMDDERRELRSFLRKQLRPSLEVLAAGIQLSRSEMESSTQDVELVLHTVGNFAAAESHGPDVEYNLACLYALADRRKVARRRLETAFGRTSPSDQLLFVWRVMHDLTLEKVRAEFLKRHPNEVRDARRAGTSSPLHRSWV